MANDEVKEILHREIARRAKLLTSIRRALGLHDHCDDAEILPEIERLRAINAEQVAACKAALGVIPMFAHSEVAVKLLTAVIASEEAPPCSQD